MLTFLSPSRNHIAYCRTDQGLRATYKGEGQARLVQLESLDGLGCGLAAAPAAPPRHHVARTTGPLVVVTKILGVIIPVPPLTPPVQVGNLPTTMKGPDGRP